MPPRYQPPHRSGNYGNNTSSNNIGHTEGGPSHSSSSSGPSPSSAPYPPPGPHRHQQQWDQADPSDRFRSLPDRNPNNGRRGGGGGPYNHQGGPGGRNGGGGGGSNFRAGGGYNGRGGGRGGARGGRAMGQARPPPVKQERIYLYDQRHLDTTYNTNHADSVAEKGERWWDNPKNFLQFICRAIDPPPQFEAVPTPGLPPNWTRLEYRVQTPDPELIIIGRGDGKNKKDAERICALDLCYQLEKHSLIEYYRQYGRGKKNIAKSPRDWAVNFFTNKKAGLPKYENKPDPTAQGFISTLKFENIIGTGRGATEAEAMVAAATQFQQMAIARGATMVLAQPGSIEESGFTVEIAKKFFDYVTRIFSLGAPYIDYKSTGKTHQALWQAELIVQGAVRGVGKKRSKKDAENMAYVDAAVSMKKEYDGIWQQFEATKNSKGKHADVVRAPPSIHVGMDESLRLDIDQMVSSLSRQSFFTVQRPQLGAKTPAELAMEQMNQSQPTNHNRRNNRNLVGRLDAQQMAGKSARLFDQFAAYQRNPQLAKLRDSRAGLPITQYAEEITSKVRQNDVVVLVGQTGCGKTTQLPQILLEDYIKNREGGVCNIICTQPRRIAAISVAQRVAIERGERVGQSVGYQVRFDNQPPTPGGSILYCTTGIFLRMMHNEGSSGSSGAGAGGASHDPMRGVTHIVVDEVHERDIDTDFLLVLLRQMQRERRAKKLPVIKLILMSATIDTGLFASYFGEGFKGGQCPSISVPGRTFPVKQFFLNDILDTMYQTYPPSSLMQLSRNDQSQKYIQREMTVQPIGPPQPHHSSLPAKAYDSDDEEDDVDDSELDYAESILDQARSVSRMPRDEVLDAEIPAQMIAFTISHIVKSSPANGAILCFLSGWEDMQEVNRQLVNSSPLGIDYNDTNKFRIHMLHSTLPSLSQQEVFEPLTDPGMRKIILATNIAETSITIQDVVHVVDSAKVKETNYDPTKRMTTLLPTWISASSLKQRAGRAGRVQEGQYYCMMSQQRRELLDAFSIPEMLRSDLQEICLHIKSVDNSPGTKIANVLAEAIQPPDQLSVSDALMQLTSLGALDRNENLTPLGRVLATLPVEPSFGRCLILSCVFRCLDPVLTLCASLGTKDVFVSPLMKKEQADAAKMKWAKELNSDHLAMMNAYNAWQEVITRAMTLSERTGERGDPTRASFNFTDQNFLSRQALENVKRAKTQLLGLLEKAGVVPTMTFQMRQQQASAFEMGPAEYNKNSNCIPLLRAMICAGVFPNVSYKTSKKIHRTRHDNTCIVHPGSVNSMRGERLIHPDLVAEPGSLYAFSTKVRTGETQIFLRNTTRLDPISILLFAGENDVEAVGYNQLVVDDWWKFNGSDRTIRTLKNLRELMTDGFEKMFLILDHKSRNSQQQGRHGSRAGGQGPTSGVDDSNRSTPSPQLGYYGVGLDVGMDESMNMDGLLSQALESGKDWLDQPAMVRLVEGVVELLQSSDEEMMAGGGGQGGGGGYQGYGSSQHSSYYNGSGSGYNSGYGSGNNSGRNSAMDHHSGHGSQYLPFPTNSRAYGGGGSGGGYYGPGSSNGGSRPGSRAGYSSGYGHSNNNGHHGGHGGHGGHDRGHGASHGPPAPVSQDPREMWTSGGQGTGGTSWF
ncbi:tetratricopeptide repeat protein 7 [Entomortierella parvispora]|uniref:Tetratricopeptide repeat protein 7 n=1 Tax=Entomortierella parvispora TaxID=205924 RepID=A0A9P3M043_9FUNG|nr:tetratricopeptide repeat protein 7 [Entomortierella parvispora]